MLGDIAAVAVFEHPDRFFNDWFLIWVERKYIFQSFFSCGQSACQAGFAESGIFASAAQTDGREEKIKDLPRIIPCYFKD